MGNRVGFVCLYFSRHFWPTYSPILYYQAKVKVREQKVLHKVHFLWQFLIKFSHLSCATPYPVTNRKTYFNGIVVSLRDYSYLLSNSSGTVLHAFQRGCQEANKCKTRNTLHINEQQMLSLLHSGNPVYKLRQTNISPRQVQEKASQYKSSALRYTFKEGLSQITKAMEIEVWILIHCLCVLFSTISFAKCRYT